MGSLEFESISRLFLLIIKEHRLTPEQLFSFLNIEEKDGRDVLSSLVSSGKVVVGKGWILKIPHEEENDVC